LAQATRRIILRWLLVSRLFRHLDLVIVNRVLITALIACVFAYLYLALRRVHRQRSGRQLLNFAGLLASHLLLLVNSTLLVAWLLGA
jgi:hypothetical protein